MKNNTNNEMQIFYFPKCPKCKCFIIKLDLTLTFDCKCNKKNFDDNINYLTEKNDEPLLNYYREIARNWDESFGNNDEYDDENVDRYWDTVFSNNYKIFAKGLLKSEGIIKNHKMKNINKKLDIFSSDYLYKNRAYYVYYFNFNNIFKKYHISKLYDKFILEKCNINKKNIPDDLNNYNNTIFKDGRKSIEFIFKHFFQKNLNIQSVCNDEILEQIEKEVNNLVFPKEKKILNIAKTFILDIICLLKILKINPLFSNQLITPKNEGEKEFFFDENNLLFFLKNYFEIREELEDDKFHKTIFDHIYIIKEKNLILLISDFQIRLYDINDINFNNCICLININIRNRDKRHRIKKFLKLDNELFILLFGNKYNYDNDDEIIDDINVYNLTDDDFKWRDDIWLLKIEHNALNKSGYLQIIIPSLLIEMMSRYGLNVLDVINGDNLICFKNDYFYLEKRNFYFYIFKKIKYDFQLRLKIELNQQHSCYDLEIMADNINHQIILYNYNSVYLIN